MGFKRILAAIDHSSLSRSVFEQALELAHSGSANLMLFHCLTIDTALPQLSGELGWVPSLSHHAHENQHFYFEQQNRACQAMLQQYCETARQQGIQAHFSYQIADAGQGICQAAAHWGADLIVVGRRGRKGLTEALLGSVSNYVLHHACCTVLIVQSGNGQESIAAAAMSASSLEAS